MAELFRKRALEKLRSPERLDQLLSVTTPAGWLALTAVCLIVTATVIWGVYGRVATKVSGTGVIIDPRGLFDIAAAGQGEVVAMMVEVGNEVKKGQIVAGLIDPTLTKEIENQEAKLRQIESAFTESSKLLKEGTEAKRRVLFKKRLELNEQIGILKNRIEWLHKRIDILKGLFEKGLVTSKVLADRRLERDNSRLKVATSHKSLSDVIAQEADLESKEFERLSTKKLQIDDVKRSIAKLKERRKEVTQVRSLVAGRVVATLAQEGEVVRPGQAVVSVQPMGRIPVLSFYVTAFKGKRIRPGMKIQFTPSTVKREEYGFMLGKVKDVSPFPVPTAALIKALENPELVKSLLAAGPVMSVTGQFERDPKTASGLKWSSRRGDTVKISTGTLGFSEVVVQEQPPVALVIPAIKKWMGLD